MPPSPMGKAWLLAAVWAASLNDWQTFREASQQIDLFKIARPVANRFGEEGGEVVKGICAQFAVAVTRSQTWAIDWRATQRAAAPALQSEEAREWHFYFDSSPREIERKARSAALAGRSLAEGQRPDLGFISRTVRDGLSPAQPASYDDYLPGGGYVHPDYSDDPGPQPWADSYRDSGAYTLYEPCHG